MSENGEKLSKKDLTKKAFDVWVKTAMARLGISSLGVPEEKREALNLLLECCFESAFCAGGHFAIAEAADEISEAVSAKLNKELGHHGKAIIVNGKGAGIPQPDHGEA